MVLRSSTKAQSANFLALVLFQAFLVEISMQRVQYCRLTNHYTGKDDVEAQRLSANHISIFLVLCDEPNKELSWRVNAHPQSHGHHVRALVDFNRYQYAYSRTTAAHIDLPAVGDWDHTEIQRIVSSRGFDTFHFDGDGFGCRYWNFLLVQALEDEGLIAPPSAHQALEFLFSRYNRQGPSANVYTLCGGAFANLDLAKWGELQIIRYRERYQAELDAVRKRLLSESRLSIDKQNRDVRLGDETGSSTTSPERMDEAVKVLKM